MKHTVANMSLFPLVSCCTPHPSLQRLPCSRNPAVKPAAFAKLQAKWDKKLKDSGFHDIEHRARPYGPFRDSLNDIRKHLKRDTITGVDADGCSYSFNPTAQFYERRADFLREHKFRTKGDRFVYEQSVEGKPPSVIWREMRKASPKWRADWSYWRVYRSLEVSNQAFEAWRTKPKGVEV
jgi:hypothetical protein